MIEQSPLAIHLFSPDGRSLLANRAWDELWTIGEDERQEGANIFEDARLRASGLLEYVEEGVAAGGSTIATPPLLYDPTLAGRDGELRWLRGLVHPVEDGRARKMALLIEDVTESRRMEEALRESEERHRRQARELALLDQVRAVLAWELEPSDIYRTVVEATANIYGYSLVSLYLVEGSDDGERLMLQHQVGYHQVLDRIPVERGVMGRVARSGEPVLITDGEESGMLQAFEGIVSEACVPIFVGERVVGVLNVESTERTGLGEDDLRLMVVLSGEVGLAVGRARLHAEVRENEARFRSLIRNAHDIITILDADSTIRYDSPAIERVLGYAPEERIGKKGFDYVHPDDLELARRTLAEAVAAPGAWMPMEYRLRHKDGSWRDFEAHRTSLLDDPAVEGVVINYRDVTERKRAEEALRESEERFRSAFEHASTGVALVGMDRRFLRVNAALCRMLGYSEEELLSRSTEDVTHPDDREVCRARRGMALESGADRHSLEKRYIHADGRVVWVLSDISVVRDAGDEPSHFVSHFQDITERRRAEEALKSSGERFRALVQNASDMITTLDADGTIRYESPAIERVLGYPPEELVGENAYDFVHSDEVRRVRSDFRQGLKGGGMTPPIEYRFRHKDGSWRYLESIGNNLLGDPHVRGVVVNSRDVTERKKLEQRLRYQAMHDALTGLPNRTLFMDRLNQALARTGRRREPIAVLFLDLDDFKIVNDSLGHEAGDRLLADVSSRLEECVRPEDTVSRFGGDEFAVLLEGVVTEDGAERVAERISESFSGPFVLGGRDVFVNASIGIASTPSVPDGGPEEILRDADRALYKAKKRGKARYEVFDEGMDSGSLERLELEAGLRRALERGELRVFYQPKVSVETGEISSLEALVRWEHPEFGLLEPERFLAIAEETGLIHPIGEWILREICHQGRFWRDLFPNRPLRVGMNVSSRQFLHGDLVGKITDALETAGLEPENLYLEVAESVLIDDAGAAVRRLQELKDLGVHTVMDDFGAAYSSLSALRSFPLNLLQIGRSLTSRLDEESEDTAIVAAMIDLAHALGWGVVAHGVETAGQLARLRNLECDFVQGFYLSRPVTGAEASALLEAGPLPMP